jgi:hypothetical protein
MKKRPKPASERPDQAKMFDYLAIGKELIGAAAARPFWGGLLRLMRVLLERIIMVHRQTPVGKG